MPGSSKNPVHAEERLDRVRKVKRALLASLVAAAAPAVFAQPPAPTPNGSTNAAGASGVLQEVTVTGSRIPVPANVTATSPMNVVSNQDLQLSGQTDIGNLIQQLPQNIISGGVDTGNNSSPLTSTGGFQTVDLRGLGPQRTLVLVNGRRLGVGDPSTANPNPSPDIDQIPVALIERIDVVTGGASATYGSDAIAGVVNFILRTNFEGIEIDGGYSFDQHNQHSPVQADLTDAGFGVPSSKTDGGTHDLSIVMGANLDDAKGNVTGYFVYHNQAAVPGSDRDFSACQVASNLPGFVCAGSSNSNRFQIDGAGTTREIVVGNSFLPWPQNTADPPAVFNYNGFEYLQRQDERYQAGLMAHEDMYDYLQPYLEASFMDDRTNAVVAPSGLFVNQNTAPTAGPDGGFLVNCNNPLLSAQELGVLQAQGGCATPTANVNLIIGRRNTEGGGRISFYEHTNYRVVGGIKGDLGDAWSYDAYGQYYYTETYQANLNYLNTQSISNALQVTGTAANPVCISGPPCVPYNIFKQGGVTPAQLAYLYTPGTSFGTNSEQIANIDFTGDLSKWNLKSPWATDGIAVDVGADRRFESLSFAPDSAETSGLLSGFSGALYPISKSYQVSEGFGEIRIPVLQDMRFARALTLDTGYRYSSYSSGVDTNTYKFEVQYAPTQDFMLRYSFDRAVRAPNLIDLFNPQSYGQQTVQGTDPCAPTLSKAGALVPATATLAQCMRTGVTAAQYGNGGTTNSITQCVAGQCGEVIGGNPNLQAEVGYTYSLGLSLTPTFFQNFTASLDYYHIHLRGEVGTIPANVIMGTCLATGDPVDCSQIVRTSGGSLLGSGVASGGYILQTAINTGDVVVSGYELQANYRYSLGAWGTLIGTLNGSYLLHNVTQPYPGAHAYDCAGLFGATCANSVNPDWRHNLRVTWQTPWNALISAQWRFIGSSGFDNNSDDPSLHYLEEGQYDGDIARIANYSYFDLSAQVTLFKKLELRGGVNNLFDRDPPLIPSADVTGEQGASNSFLAYDLLGRQFFIQFTAKF